MKQIWLTSYQPQWLMHRVFMESLPLTPNRSTPTPAYDRHSNFAKPRPCSLQNVLQECQKRRLESNWHISDRQFFSNSCQNDDVVLSAQFERQRNDVISPSSCLPKQGPALARLVDYTVTHVYIKIEHYKQKTVIKCLAKEIHYEKSIKSLIMITRSVKREGYLLATRSQYRTTIRYPSRGLHTKLLIKYNVSHALTHDRSRYDGVSKEQIFITLTNVSARSFLLIPEFLRAPVASRRNHSMLTR